MIMIMPSIGNAHASTNELNSNFEIKAYLRPLGYERFLMKVELWDGNQKWLLIPAHEWQKMLYKITHKNTRKLQPYTQIMNEIFKKGVVRLSELKFYRDDWGDKMEKEITYHLNLYQVLPITFEDLGYPDIGSFIDDNLSCDVTLDSNSELQEYILKISQSSIINRQHIIFIMSYSGFKLDFLGRKGFDGLSISSLGNRQPAFVLKDTKICNQ